MSAKGTIKAGCTRLLQLCRIVPSIWEIRSPFKIHEFREVLRCAEPQPSESALDLGCGGGIQTQLLATKLERVTGVDTSAESIEKARRHLRWSRVRRRVSFLCGPLQQQGLAAGSLDCVFSFCVLEHIPELDAVLAEIHRLLKKGGRLQVSVDSLGTIQDQRLIEKHRQDHYVHQYFTVESLSSQLQAAGFKVATVFPILTGPFARQEFERRICEKNMAWPIMKRLKAYRRICREDREARGNHGIMLVGHAIRA